MSTFDANGRPIPAAPTFPDVEALVDHIHANGQKVGIYWIPGIEQPAVDGNYPILGTSYTTQQIVAIPLAQGNAFAGPLLDQRLGAHRAADQPHGLECMSSLSEHREVYSRPLW